MIEIKNEDDEKFVSLILTKYRGKIETLKSEGVFDFKNGKVIIHVDNDGKIRQIETYKINYKN